MISRPDVVVVGAGAAGIFAAWRAATCGAKVVLLEKTARIGTKILISGGGKCNIAHAGPLEDVIRAFRPNEAKFIRPACYRLPNVEIVRMVESRGLRVYTRPDGRVFPVDQTAKDVVAILERYLREANVEVLLNGPVEEIFIQDGHATGVRVGECYEPHTGYRPREQGAYGAKALLADVLASSLGSRTAAGVAEIECSQVVVACGGSSYPNSGTTGDGWRWARSLGHTVVKPRAALAPIYVQGSDPSWAGVAIRDCVLRARLVGKEAAKWHGDVLFTHRGVSGPAALGISREVSEALERGEVSLEVDLAGSQSPDGLSVSVQELARRSPRRLVAGFVDEMVPERLVSSVLAQSEVAEGTTLAQLDRKGRNRLVSALKAWRLGSVSHVPIEKGEVVAGGISLDEVDPQTMRSKVVEGLYLCGEVLDVAGPVGGYNLQAAFATGYVAGETAAKDAVIQP